MTTASLTAFSRTINSLGTTGVHNVTFGVHNYELSRARVASPAYPVDTCVQSGASRKSSDAGTMTRHPQSTALITRTILNYEFLMLITGHEVDKGRPA